jgi:hydroxymethylglutaryl-CoA lyase
MANDKLTGNMPSEIVLNYFKTKHIETEINESYFEKAFGFSSKIFNF